MKPELPPDCEFHEDIRLFIHRPRGLLNAKVLERLVSILGDLEAASKEPFDRFTDTLEADAVDLNFRSILKVSLFRRLTYEGRPEVKSAMLATDSTIIQYAELHKLMTEGSPIEFQIFQDRQKAAEWLGVPLGRLEDGKATGVCEADA
jgi:hypothetical protein